MCRCCKLTRKVQLVDSLTGLGNGHEICPLCDTVPTESGRAGPPNAGYR